MNLDYTSQGRRPTAAQIVSAWKKGGCPSNFTVEYGETFAEFVKVGDRWQDGGNGCRGVQRDKVVAALTAVGEAIDRPANYCAACAAHYGPSDTARGACDEGKPVASPHRTASTRTKRSPAQGCGAGKAGGSPVPNRIGLINHSN